MSPMTFVFIDVVTEPEPVTPMFVVNIGAVAEPVTQLSFVCIDAER